MPTTKTANSFLADKVALRLAHLPEQKTVRVLDCFAGRGTIWAAVRKLAPERDIRVLPIEIQPEEDTLFSLPGDNSRFLETLDLNRFDVIDLDPYGTPAPLLAAAVTCPGPTLPLFLSLFSLSLSPSLPRSLSPSLPLSPRSLSSRLAFPSRDSGRALRPVRAREGAADARLFP